MSRAAAQQAVQLPNRQRPLLQADGRSGSRLMLLQRLFSAGSRNDWIKLLAEADAIEASPDEVSPPAQACPSSCSPAGKGSGADEGTNDPVMKAERSDTIRCLAVRGLCEPGSEDPVKPHIYKPIL